MDNTNSKICKEFKSELWLILDDSLENQSKHNWGNHLKSCTRCTSALKEAKETLKLYNNLPIEDVTNSTFKKMIKNAVASGKIQDASEYTPSIQKNRSLVEIFGFYKLAFGGSVLTAAMIFIFITFFNDPKIPEMETRVSQELLSWNTPEINNRLIDVENQIISLQTNDWDIYIVRKNKKEEWYNAIRAIQKQIRKMRKEVVSTSM
jgi:hypothetical protein